MPNVAGHYGPYGASFQECVAKVGSFSDDPEGFCNWVHQQAQGGSPGSEERGDGAGAGVKFRCSDCDALAPVEWKDGAPVYARHDPKVVPGVIGAPCCKGAGQALRIAEEHGDAWQEGVHHHRRCDLCKRKVPVLETADGGTYITHATTDGAPCKGSGAKWKRATTDAPERVKRYDRWDQTALGPPKRLSNGFLRVDARIARVGVQVYQQPDGTRRRELRLPEEVSKPATLASFALMPATNTHPPFLLSAENARDFVVGAVGENVRMDERGEWTMAPLMFYDAAAIDSIENGRSEVSCGYECELEDAPGVWRGIDGKGLPEEYDVIQRHIEGNHVAAVDRARAGAGASMRLDARDALMLASEPTPPPTGEKPMAKSVRIDGLPLELTDSNADAIQAAVDRSIVHATAKAGEATTAEKARADAAEATRTTAQKALTDLQKKWDKRQAHLDAKKKEMAECDECEGEGEYKDDDEKMTECPNCKGEGKVPAHDDDDGDGDGDEDDEPKAKAKKDKKKKDAEKKHADSLERLMHRRVRERVALEVEARAHLDADVELAGIDALGIKKLVVMKVDGEEQAKLDGASPDYIQARYDLALKKAGDAPTASDRVRAAARGSGTGTRAPRTDAPPSNVKDAAAAYAERQRSAWKPAK